MKIYLVGKKKMLHILTISLEVIGIRVISFVIRVGAYHFVCCKYLLIQYSISNIYLLKKL